MFEKIQGVVPMLIVRLDGYWYIRICENRQRSIGFGYNPDALDVLLGTIPYVVVGIMRRFDELRA